MKKIAALTLMNASDFGTTIELKIPPVNALRIEDLIALIHESGALLTLTENSTYPIIPKDSIQVKVNIK